MSAPTYSLTPKMQLEKSYYTSVEELAIEVMDQTAKIFHPITSSVAVVSPEQACLELLLLGIYARRGIEAGEEPTLEYLVWLFDSITAIQGLCVSDAEATLMATIYHRAIHRIVIWYGSLLTPLRIGLLSALARY